MKINIGNVSDQISKTMIIQTPLQPIHCFKLERYYVPYTKVICIFSSIKFECLHVGLNVIIFDKYFISCKTSFDITNFHDLYSVPSIGEFDLLTLLEFIIYTLYISIGEFDLLTLSGRIIYILYLSIGEFDSLTLIWFIIYHMYICVGEFFQLVTSTTKQGSHCR